MSHMHEGEVELSNTRNGLHAEWEANWEGEYEIYADYQRFLSRFLGIYAGGTFTDEEWEVGVEYVLTKHLSIAGNYHSEFDGGAGLLVRC